ncbi:MAG: large repetitive protein, partial [Frankiaceae bacterium]|nr:large repetitive protein [Frankiaceae bacterium]
TINGLKNGQSYAFSVQASNANGAGPSATSALVTPAVPLTPPGPPAAVVAHAASASATVTWLPPASNGGSPITGYTVTSSPDGRSTTVGGSAVSAQLTGLTNGTSYTFTVRATNAKGSSAASTPSVAVIPRAPTTVPAAPTAPTAVPGDRTVQLTWTRPADGGSPITGYAVTPSVRGVAQPSRTFPSTSTTQTISGLDDGSPYTFTVAALNANGHGPASPASVAVTPSPTTVSGSAATRATTYGATVTVSGTAPSGSTVGIWFRASNETAFSQRRTLRASPTGTWSTTYVAATDERIFATAGSATSAAALVQVAPTIAGAAARSIPRGSTTTLAGTASPGSTVTLHIHRAGTAVTDYSTLLTTTVPANGAWSKAYKPSVDCRFYATLPNGQKSATFLVQLR